MQHTAEIIPDDNAVDVDQMLDNEKIKAMIVKSLSSLSKREEMVMRLRFGISDVSEDDVNIYTIEK